MNQRDRLIELIKNAKTNEPFDMLTVDIDTAIDMPHGDEYLADYLLAKGVIVPPCKVGDMVYIIQNKRIYEGTVILIRPFIYKEEYTRYHGNVQYECQDPFYCDGRMMTHEVFVVFEEYGSNTIAHFSREDAEKALKSL